MRLPTALEGDGGRRFYAVQDAAVLLNVPPENVRRNHQLFLATSCGVRMPERTRGRPPVHVVDADEIDAERRDLLATLGVTAGGVDGLAYEELQGLRRRVRELESQLAELQELYGSAIGTSEAQFREANSASQHSRRQVSRGRDEGDDVSRQASELGRDEGPPNDAVETFCRPTGGRNVAHDLATYLYGHPDIDRVTGLSLWWLAVSGHRAWPTCLRHCARVNVLVPKSLTVLRAPSVGALWARQVARSNRPVGPCRRSVSRCARAWWPGSSSPGGPAYA